MTTPVIGTFAVGNFRFQIIDLDLPPDYIMFNPATNTGGMTIKASKFGMQNLVGVIPLGFTNEPSPSSLVCADAVIIEQVVSGAIGPTLTLRLRNSSGDDFCGSSQDPVTGETISDPLKPVSLSGLSVRLMIVGK